MSLTTRFWPPLYVTILTCSLNYSQSFSVHLWVLCLAIISLDMTMQMWSLYSIQNDQVVPGCVWKWMKFPVEKTMTFTIPYCIIMCQRVAQRDGNGYCNAVCARCDVKRKPKGLQTSVSYKERKRKCHHEFHNLVDQYVGVALERDQQTKLDGRSSRMCLLLGNVCIWRRIMIFCIEIKYLSRWL